MEIIDLRNRKLWTKKWKKLAQRIQNYIQRNTNKSIYRNEIFSIQIKFISRFSVPSGKQKPWTGGFQKSVFLINIVSFLMPISR